MQMRHFYQTPEPVLLQEPCEQSLPLTASILVLGGQIFTFWVLLSIKLGLHANAAEGLRRSFVFEQNV